MKSAPPTGRFEEDGFQILKGLFSAGECESLISEIDVLFKRQQTTAKSKIGGLRNLLQTNDRIAQVASTPSLISTLEQMMGAKPFPVRAIFFDKTPQTNWLVPWHQDLTIAVSERIETAGFNAWSVKEGAVHVQPPTATLERMVAVRIHLDDCGVANGALKVIAGSHRHGKLSTKQIAERAKEPAVTCEVGRGDVLLMRPLILHASSPSDNPSHRRVLHIEYSGEELPNGLKWLEQI